jgi:prevent-host-death family protein
MPDDASKRPRRKAPSKAHWSIADAKARLSELVEKTRSGAQTITRNGKPVAVVVGVDEWARKNRRKGTLVEFFQSAPEGFADLDFRRSREVARDAQL